MRKITQTIVGTTPPLDKNVLWLDTTNSNEPVQKLFLNGEWKPLKDSDVDAEFSTGEKVSNISISKTSSSTTDNSKLPTVEKVNSALNKKVNIALDGTIIPEKIDDNLVVNIDIRDIVNKNITILEVEDRCVDIINLDRVDTNSDYVATIRFNSSDTPTSIVYDDTELKWVNEELPICEAGAEYLIAIWKNIGVMTKLNTIEISNS